MACALNEWSMDMVQW